MPPTLQAGCRPAVGLGLLLLSVLRRLLRLRRLLWLRLLHGCLLEGALQHAALLEGPQLPLPALQLALQLKRPRHDQRPRLLPLLCRRPLLLLLLLLLLPLCPPPLALGARQAPDLRRLAGLARNLGTTLHA